MTDGPRRVATPVLLTLGYQQRSIDEFVEILQEANVHVLIDVRETAWSHKPGFSKGSLSRTLASAGIEYVHAREVGNPKGLRALAPSHAECLEWYAHYLDEFCELLESFDDLVARLHRAGKRVCLTCYERHPADCHRSILAERWRTRRGGVLEHLAPDGCPRILPVTSGATTPAGFAWDTTAR